MNKQELLKTAVIALNGKLSEHTQEYITRFGSEGNYNSTDFKSKNTLFTKQEFEQKAKEMGYINGYRYGIEYLTNGKKPDLPDDIFIDVKCEKGTNEWQEWTDMTVADTAWTTKHNSIPATSFKIVDQRYEPADTSYLVELGMELVNQSQEKLESVTEKLEANSWWDYENDAPLSFPPAGTHCLVSYKTLALQHEWIETFVVGVGVDGSCVFDLTDFADGDNPYDGWLNPERFRPLDYFTRKEAEAEKKRVVDAAAEKFHSSIMPDYSGQPFLDGLGALYDAGYLVLPEKKEE